MVCEDDISFTASGDCLAQTVQDFLADSVMDVLCIGNNPQRTPIAWSDTLSLTSDTQTTSCYVVKRSAAKALTRNLQRGLSRLKRTGNASRYALDVYWKKLQGGRLIFCLPTERLAAQRPSFSDIQDVWVDYGV
jgi:glycosyl transferase family 25